jgi:hypothetical protein
MLASDEDRQGGATRRLLTADRTATDETKEVAAFSGRQIAPDELNRLLGSNPVGVFGGRGD